jgi:hypothetical protein
MLVGSNDVLRREVIYILLSRAYYVLYTIVGCIIILTRNRLNPVYQASISIGMVTLMQ